MSTVRMISSTRELALLEAAQGGDEGAYRSLIQNYEGELHAHCYRMLGSMHDAEDALQDALLRAWRALPRFERRSSLRSWLYRLATNTSLDTINRRPKRVLPVGHVAPSDPDAGPGEPLTETVWIEPYPDEMLGLEDGYAAPEARYERRESVELAFVAALQLLPPRQRAVLILREVLGYSAQETAATLETTVASVNSALQRARKTVEDHLPERSQQATLRTLGDDATRELVERYATAMDHDDVDTVVSMLVEEDAAWSMPPLSSWYSGLDAITRFLHRGPCSGEWRWRRLPTRANGQPAVAAYVFDAEEDAFLPFAVDVLTIRGDRIADVTAFITRTMDLPDRESFQRLPDEAVDARRTAAVFERFGLPARIEA